MARMARSEVFDPQQVQTVHVYNRCVRGMYLMGRDQRTGQDHSHRRSWFLSQLQLCSAYFGIDLLEHAIMENHFHLLLRSRPDLVGCWGNLEVARRWLMLCPKRKEDNGTAKEPTQAELRSLTKNPDVLKQLRRRLSDISWFVRKVCQSVAQRANGEHEGSFGKFWDQRFKAVCLLDESSLVACSAYINLNPLRAGAAGTLEESQFASLKHRLEQLEARARQIVQSGQCPGTADFEPAATQPASTQPAETQPADTEIVATEAAAEATQALSSALDDCLPSDLQWALETTVKSKLPITLYQTSDQPLPAPFEIAAFGTDLLVPELQVSRLSEDLTAPAQALPPRERPKLADILTERLDQVRAEYWGAQADDQGQESPEMAELRKLPPEPICPGGYLTPLEIDEKNDPLGPRPSRSPQRASDKGYLSMPLGKYIELLEWSARQIRPDKRGYTSEETPPIIQRLGISEEAWLKLVTSFGELFSVVAGMPESVDAHRGTRRQRFHMPTATRQLLSRTPENPPATRQADSEEPQAAATPASP